MIDRYGRTIDYMRVSVTDRCNLRCVYCMPKGAPPEQQNNILNYEEMLRLCRIAVTLGITKFKVTGGEPFTRRDCAPFIVSLKTMPGVEQVTVTTNGLLLADHIESLRAAGIDGINFSINTLNEQDYREVTRSAICPKATILRTLQQCVKRNIRVKINTVLLAQTFNNINEIALLAKDMPVDVRFIELMPIGEGAAPQGIPMAAALERLKELWPDLHPTNEKRGNGPAHYYAASGLQGHIGFIAALTHGFCDTCNRIRLISTGMLKPCLCYGEGIELKTPLRNGCTDEELRALIQKSIMEKPPAHCLENTRNITEHAGMYRIGG